MILADTNILLRLFLRDDPAQFRAVERWLDRARESRTKCLVHTAAVAETVWVLQLKGWTREAIVDALLELCASDQFQLLELEMVKTALAFYLEGRVSFIDACQAAYVTEHGFKGILSFDRDFDGLGVKRIGP